MNNIKGRAAAAFIPPLDAFGKAEPVCVHLNYMPMEYTDGCAKNMYFSFCRQCINNDDNNMAAPSLYAVDEDHSLINFSF